ncbi:VTI1B [Auxenochlorella protothecoides x Auxenochlorella symbiontica]
MAETSSPLFAQYEREYATKSTEASRKIQSLGPLRGDQRQKRVKEAEADLLEAEHILQRLDIEARSLPPVTSRALLQKLKDYKADIAKLRSDAKTAGTSSAESRAELGLGNEYFQTSAGQRDRLLTATDRLGKTSDRIQAGRQQLLETEELGISVLGDLQRQRETILHSRDALAGVDEGISRSRAILSSMSRRIMQNKIIMWGIVALLLGAIGLIVWAKLS